MKSIKKTLSILLSLAIILSVTVMAVPSASATGTYKLSDLSKSQFVQIKVRDSNGNLTTEGKKIINSILNYAKTYSQTGGGGEIYSRNRDPMSHSYEGANCTCFISQCLAQGVEFGPGDPNVSNDEFYYWNKTISNSSASTRASGGLLQYCRNGGAQDGRGGFVTVPVGSKSHTAYSKFDFDKLKEGDLLFADMRGSLADTSSSHSMIIIKADGINSVFACSTSDGQFKISSWGSRNLKRVQAYRIVAVNYQVKPLASSGKTLNKANEYGTNGQLAYAMNSKKVPLNTIYFHDRTTGNVAYSLEYNKVPVHAGDVMPTGDSVSSKIQGAVALGLTSDNETYEQVNKDLLNLGMSSSYKLQNQYEAYSATQLAVWLQAGSINTSSFSALSYTVSSSNLYSDAGTRVWNAAKFIYNHASSNSQAVSSGNYSAKITKGNDYNIIPYGKGMICGPFYIIDNGGSTTAKVSLKNAPSDAYISFTCGGDKTKLVGSNQAFYVVAPTAFDGNITVSADVTSNLPVVKEYESSYSSGSNTQDMIYVDSTGMTSSKNITATLAKDGTTNADKETPAVINTEVPDGPSVVKCAGKAISASSKKAVDIYSMADPEAAKVGTVKAGVEFDFTAVDLENDYIKVSYNGVTGWCKGTTDSVVKLSEADKRVSLKSGISSSTMRTGPGSDYSSVSTVKSGVALVMAETNNNWYKVYYNGDIGYVNASDFGEAVINSVESDKYAMLVSSGESLNFRSGPSTSYAQIGTLPSGTELPVLEQNSSTGFIKVNYNGVNGWCSGSTSYVSVFTKGSWDANVMPNIGSLNIRKGPSTSYSTVGSVSEGKAITITAKGTNGWYKIKYGTVTGYCSSEYITLKDDKVTEPTQPVVTEPTEPEQPLTPDEPVAPDEPLIPDEPTEPEDPVEDLPETDSFAMLINPDDSLKLRSGPSTSYSQIGTLPGGVELPVYDENDSTGFIKVSYNGKTGWCSGSPSYVTIFTKGNWKANVMSGIGSLYIRKGPTVKYSTLGSIPAGKSIKVLAMGSNDWLKIEYGTKIGYCSGNYINVKDEVITEPTQPTEPVAPVEPTQPTEPVTPVEPQQPSEPDVPAEPQQTGKVAILVKSGDTLRLRSGPSASYSQIGTLPSGVELPILEQNSSTGFIKVSYNGKTGWCSGSSSYVAIFNEGAWNANIKSGIGSLNLRKGPATGYKSLGTIKEGKAVTVLGKGSNGWLKVKYDTKTGYCSGEFVNVKDAITTDPTVPAEPEQPTQPVTPVVPVEPEKPTEPTEQKGTGLIVIMDKTTNYLNIRSGPSASYPSIGKVTTNDEIEVLEKNSTTGFLKISYNGKTGWIIGSTTYVTVVEAMSAKASVKGVDDYLNIRKGPASAFASIGKLYPNQKFDVIGKTLGWYKIKSGNTVGYVSATYVKLG